MTKSALHGCISIAALLLSLAATAEPSDAVVEFQSVVPHDVESRARLFRGADGSFIVEATCAGCILDASILEWTTADTGGRRAILSEVEVQFGIHDEARIYVDPASLPSVFAIDVLLLYADPSQGYGEVTMTVFGEHLSSGEFRRITFEDFACRSGLMECIYEGDTLTQVNLNLPLVESSR